MPYVASWEHEWKRQGEEKGKHEGKLEGKLEGKREEKLNTARTMIEKNYPIDAIIEITGLTKKEINALMH